MFKLHIDELRLGAQSAGSIFAEMISGNNMTTTMFRWVSWVMSVAGHYLLFTPILRLVSWIPLVGFLIVKLLAMAALIFSFVWATMLHFFVLSIAWVFYRPCFGACMLLACGVCLGLTTYGSGMVSSEEI
jgi:hypothetical protein